MGSQCLLDLLIEVWGMRVRTLFQIRCMLEGYHPFEVCFDLLV